MPTSSDPLVEVADAPSVAATRAAIAAAPAAATAAPAGVREGPLGPSHPASVAVAVSQRRPRLGPDYTDADELAAALRLTPAGVRYHGKRLRFGAPVRADVHIYPITGLNPADRETILAYRGQQADGTHDRVALVDRRIHPHGLDQYNHNEKLWGRQASRFVLVCEETHQRERLPYPQAVQAVVVAEQRRAVRAADTWFPVLTAAGALDLVPRAGTRSDSPFACPAYNNFRKWKQLWNRWRTHDLDSSQWWCLCPQYRVAALKHRRDTLGTLALTETEIEQIRYYKLHYESPFLALKMYAESPQCRPIVAAFICDHCDAATAPSLPPSIERALHIPREIFDRHRSTKRFAQRYTQIRGAFYINKAGEQVELVPGDLFEADDMTINTPLWWEWPWGGDPCSDKYGVRIGRGQLLAMRDVRSGKWLGFTLLMRHKDSYRAVDILGFTGRIFRDVGLPRLCLRYEQGIWKSKRIEGQPIYQADGTIDRRFAGMTDLDIGLQHATGSKGKAHIEQGFDIFQHKHDGDRIAGDLVTVGRFGGEFDRENKLWLSCREGHTDPRTVFPHGDLVATYAARAFAWLNAHWRIRGRIQNGFPDAVWDRHITPDRPLQTLPRDKEWIFLPDYAERAVRDAALRVDRTDAGWRREYTFEIAPWVKDGLADGYRLHAFFDAAEPDLGAWLFNAETRPCNRNAWPQGHFIGIARHIPEAAQFDLSGAPAGGGGARQRVNAAFRLNYQSLCGRQRLIRETADGRGNLARHDSPRAGKGRGEGHNNPPLPRAGEGRGEGHNNPPLPRAGEGWGEGSPADRALAGIPAVATRRDQLAQTRNHQRALGKVFADELTDADRARY